jgi:hypothetical protein
MEELQTNHQKSRLQIWLGHFCCVKAARHPWTQFSFYAAKILPSYNANIYAVVLQWKLGHP